MADLFSWVDTNGDSLRSIIENVFKALANFLNMLGEWPIDFE